MFLYWNIYYQMLSGDLEKTKGDFRPWTKTQNVHTVKIWINNFKSVSVFKHPLIVAIMARVTIMASYSNQIFADLDNQILLPSLI